MEYYVYAYIRKTNGIPYYIGKGKGSRCIDRHPGVSVPKDHSKIILMEQNLTNIGACALERFYIRWYGRKDLGAGVLLNKTNGGDGTNGMPHTEEWKRNHSKKLKGRPLSKEHIEKIKKIDRSYMQTEEYKEAHSKGLSGRRKRSGHSVMTPKGRFEEITLAAKAFNIGRTAINHRMKALPQEYYLILK